MSMDWAQTIIGLVWSATAAGAVTAAVNGAFNRRKTDAETQKAEADAADVLTGKALTMVSKLEEQVSRAQARVGELDQETVQLRTDLRAANVQVDELNRKVTSLIAAIMAPDATLERLRAMVGHGPAVNGRG